MMKTPMLFNRSVFQVKVGGAETTDEIVASLGSPFDKLINRFNFPLKPRETLRLDKLEVIDPDKKFIRFAMKTDENINIATVKEEVKAQMLKRYKDDEFSIVEPTEILSVVNGIFGILNLVLVATASISLLVGGIGIMNIMYVTVSDKTKEVGIRRAIGARKNDILFQFIVEAVALSIIGGALGLGLAYLGILFVQPFFPAYIDVASVALALGVSSGIGIIFGVLPARKAANLEPVEAIRYE